jgi:hypothetical protein
MTHARRRRRFGLHWRETHSVPCVVYLGCSDFSAERLLVNLFTSARRLHHHPHLIAMTERRKWTAIPGLLALAIGPSCSPPIAAPPPRNTDRRSADQLPAPGARAEARHELSLLPQCGEQVDGPGLPAVGTCIGCHSMVGPERPASDLGPKRHSDEIAKLWKYADVAMQGAAMGPNAKPIPWVRIHKLPEYVHFPHTRHISAGVTCQSCHGQIQNMDRVFQYASPEHGLVCELSRPTATARRKDWKPPAMRRSRRPPPLRRPRRRDRRT